MMDNRIKIEVLIFLKSLIVFMGSAENTEADECPCKIDMVTKTAECHPENRLKAIPRCIPLSTEILDLSDNDLRYKQGQFQQFSNLTYLDLSNNHNFAPGKAAFSGLVNLEVLYLNYTHYMSPRRGVFTGLTRLRKLALDGNVDGEELEEDLFAGLSELTHLVIRNNRQINLQNKQFSRLYKLMFLDLSFNFELRNLGTHTFADLTQLKYLSMGASGWFYEDVPADIFQPLTSLEELNIVDLCNDHRSPYPQTCSLIDEYLQHLVSLQRLYIHNKVLEQPLGRGFSFLVNLEEVHFSNIAWRLPRPCHIENFWHETTLQYLTSASLFELSIDHCSVTDTGPNVFSKFKYLMSLELVLTTDICDPFIENICIGLPDTMIRRLVLSFQCEFRGHPEPSLEDLKATQLEYLDFSNGPLTMIDNLFIACLPMTLKYLSLSYNKIKFIDYEAFNSLENLIVLDLSNQADGVSVSSNTVLRPPKLQSQEVNPNTNLVKTRNVSQSVGHSVMNKKHINKHEKMSIIRQTTDDCVPLPFRLKSLNLSYSKLLCGLEEVLCGGIFSLKILNISYLRDLECMDLVLNMLKTIESLEMLDLRGNSLRRLNENIFSTLTQLTYLNLADNLFLEVSFNIKLLTSLKILDIASNTIQFASETFTKQVETLAKVTDITVYLSDNRLICDCDRIYFVAWLKHSSVIFEKKKLDCSFKNGTEMSLTKVSTILYLLESECIMLDVTLSCIAGYVTMTLLGLILAMFWHNGLKFRYLMAFAKRTINPYHPLEESTIQLEYDVYISYDRDFSVNETETLHDFVTSKLYPALQRKGMRVLIRDELEIGMRLYEVISHALRKCDKLLVLLSKEYCNDYWNVFEFNTAAMEGIYTKRQVIIPVAFESLRQADFHEEVRAFLCSGPVPVYTNKIPENDFLEYLCDKIRDNRPFD